MSRRNAYGFVSATILSVTLFGCGPREAGTRVTGGAAPVTLEVKSRPAKTRQTWSRKEIREWVTEGMRVSKTTDDFKAKFGPPARTHEDARRTWMYWEYDGISVDADGSGKTDQRAAFKFFLKGAAGEKPVAQSAIEFVP